MRLDLNWTELFVPSVPLAELFVRGSLTYLSLFVLMRVVLKREAGTVGMADLLMIVLIADAAQNAMASDYRSIPEGIVLVGTIVFWNYTLDWLSYHYPLIRHLLQPQPLLLVKEGRMHKRNMREELITGEELLSELRKQGVEDVATVKEAWMEEDGHISVIKHEASHTV
jgi:uncharacterized membrane protein YcaP (DUF421 family)